MRMEMPTTSTARPAHATTPVTPGIGMTRAAWERWHVSRSPGSSIVCRREPPGRRWRGGFMIICPSELQFFPKLAAFNIGWHEVPRRTIFSYIAPRGYLTKPGFPNHAGDHERFYQGFPALA